MKNSRVALPAVLLVAGLALAGCSAAGGGSTAYDQGGSSSSSGSAGSAPDVATGGKAVPGSDSASNVDRSVIVTGTVTVTATDPIAQAQKAVALVEAAGGRVDGRTENAAANGDRGSATLVLRIPAAKLTATLAQLKKLGRADEVQLDSADVTSQSQDLDARITALRATITRLLQLESTATDTTNLIAIETAIGDRQGELEGLEAQQRGLADQVSMSTITLNLRSDAAAPPVKPADFWSGLGAGWGSFATFWATALVALGVLLPWLVFAGVVTAIVLLILRWRRTHRATPTATPAAATAAPVTPSEPI